MVDQRYGTDDTVYRCLQSVQLGQFPDLWPDDAVQRWWLHCDDPAGLSRLKVFCLGGQILRIIHPYVL